MSGSEPAGGPLETARRVLEAEAAAIGDLIARLDASFGDAVALLAECRGRVIASGIGKSGIVARKIASTLTSTGTPSTFLHPVEGLHGDLGLVGPADVALLVSKSGDTEELAGLLAQLVRRRVPVVALTTPGSTLAKDSTVVIDCSVAGEACPMDLAPTSSTTAAMAMGDALAVAVLTEKGFEAEDFAQNHPGGRLGRRLTIRVADVMERGERVPTLGSTARVRDTILPLAEQRGTVAIVDEKDTLLGVFTTGDLTRLMERDAEFLEVDLSSVMTRTPRTARADELGSAAVARMEKHGVMALPVLDANKRVVGMVHLHDLMRSGVV